MTELTETNEQLAKEHLRQAWTTLSSDWTSDHLTAALVYAVLAVNDTLNRVGEVLACSERR